MERFDYEWLAHIHQYVVFDRTRGHDRYDLASTAVAKCSRVDDAEKVTNALNAVEDRHGGHD